MIFKIQLCPDTENLFFKKKKKVDIITIINVNAVGMKLAWEYIYPV